MWHVLYLRRQKTKICLAVKCGADEIFLWYAIQLSKSRGNDGLVNTKNYQKENIAERHFYGWLIVLCSWERIELLENTDPLSRHCEDTWSTYTCRTGQRISYKNFHTKACLSCSLPDERYRKLALVLFYFVYQIHYEESGKMTSDFRT